MNKILKYISYYLLLISGLIMISWIIWSRFICERTIRNIPDNLFTEYRFWILLYICCIYIIVVKNLIKPSSGNIVFDELSKYLYKPLITLDHLIKYNSKVKPYYYKLIKDFASTIYRIEFYHGKIFIFFMQILPRAALVTFLLRDVFIIHKIEIFYKIILIGLLPLILRYLKYSLKDIYHYWIIELETKYSGVYVYENGYKFDKTRVGQTDAVFHAQNVTIKEYVDIKFDNTYDYMFEVVTYKYESLPHCRKEIVEQYNVMKYNPPKRFLPVTDYDILDKLYYELIPNIIFLKQYFYRLELINKEKLILWPKIVIFSLYFICWSFVLLISYIHFSIPLEGAKYLLCNFARYLISLDNPFHELHCGSLNSNLITPSTVKELIIKIVTNIASKFK